MQYSVGRAKAGAGRRNHDRSVELRDLHCQHIDIRGRKFPAREEPARELVLRELAHLYRVFERRALAADDRSVDASGNRDDVEVQRGREASIEPQLLFAEEAPRRERREIEKPEVHRLLELVRVAPGEQHVGDVRLEHRHAFTVGAERRRPRQRGDEPRLVLPLPTRVGCHLLSYRRDGIVRQVILPS